jgi:hypothetical protein
MTIQDNKAAKAPAASEAEPPPPTPVRYRILSGGVTGAGGVTLHYDTTVIADLLGDQERIDKLLRRGSIRVADAAE